MIITNFGAESYRLSKNQVVGMRLPLPTVLIPSSFSKETMGLIEEEKKFSIGNEDHGDARNEPQDFYFGLPHPEAREEHGTCDAATVEALELSDVRPPYRQRLLAFLRRFNSLWSGELY